MIAILMTPAFAALRPIGKTLMTQPLFLIGPRGCGKTTVGMALADSLNRRFVDTDQWLQSQLNMTVAEIVEREEWAGFRARETAALEAVTAPSTVIATGGGIILTEFNRHFMQNNGIVVYLCAPVSVWLTDCKLHRKKIYYQP